MAIMSVLILVIVFPPRKLLVGGGGGHPVADQRVAASVVLQWAR